MKITITTQEYESINQSETLITYKFTYTNSKTFSKSPDGTIKILTYDEENNYNHEYINSISPSNYSIKIQPIGNEEVTFYNNKTKLFSLSEGKFIYIRPVTQLPPEEGYKHPVDDIIITDYDSYTIEAGTEIFAEVRAQS